jgi:Bacterial regulatory helix-turn-helix protein, lysR family
MDRLMALRAFARVVELGGFTKAGDSLRLSKTTVSDLVQEPRGRPPGPAKSGGWRLRNSFHEIDAR